MNRLILAASFWSEENMKSILDNLIKWFMTVGKNILIAIVILIIGNKLIKWVLKLIGNSFKKTKIEPMVAKFLISLIKFALYFLIAIIVISVLGIPTTSLIAALSAAGLTLGLALQGSLSNFAGGVLILLLNRLRSEIILKKIHMAMKERLQELIYFTLRLLPLTIRQ